MPLPSPFSPIAIAMGVILWMFVSTVCRRMYPYEWFKKLPDDQKSTFITSHMALMIGTVNLPSFVLALLR